MPSSILTRYFPFPIPSKTPLAFVSDSCFEPRKATNRFDSGTLLELPIRADTTRDKRARREGGGSARKRATVNIGGWFTRWRASRSIRSESNRESQVGIKAGSGHPRPSPSSVYSPLSRCAPPSAAPTRSAAPLFLSFPLSFIESRPCRSRLRPSRSLGPTGYIFPTTPRTPAPSSSTLPLSATPPLFCPAPSLTRVINLLCLPPDSLSFASTASQLSSRWSYISFSPLRRPHRVRSSNRPALPATLQPRVERAANEIIKDDRVLWPFKSRLARMNGFGVTKSFSDDWSWGGLSASLEWCRFRTSRGGGFGFSWDLLIVWFVICKNSNLELRCCNSGFMCGVK